MTKLGFDAVMRLNGEEGTQLALNGLRTVQALLKMVARTDFRMSQEDAADSIMLIEHARGCLACVIATRDLAIDQATKR